MLKKGAMFLVMVCLVITTFSVYNLELKVTAPPNVSIPTVPIIPKTVDKMQMLSVVVRVNHEIGSGSGVIIYREHVKQDNKYTYYVVTNSHVVHNRLTSELEVDGIRGRYRIITIDPGVVIRVFRDVAAEWTEYNAEVVAESPTDDLALIKFSTDDFLSGVVELADTEVVSSVEVFDQVYAVGCQLGELLIPTEGIISGFVRQDNLMLIIHTAHVLPGSSGGGLFKQYDGQYRLIGLTFAVRSYNFQILPHYSYALSTEMIYRFLYNNDMSFIYENGMVNEVQHAG